MNEKGSLRDFILFLILILSFFPFLLPEASAAERSWIADFKTTVLSPTGRQILFTGKFYQSGSKVRFEPTDSAEIDLFDFGRAIGIRLFQEDRIYFQNRLTSARMAKAVKEGWIAPPPAVPEKRILLREGTIKEREARLYLVILGQEDQKVYSLLWTTADEAALPLQAIYPASGYETVIVEYDRIRIEPVGPEHFEPPADFLNLNP
ncbi:MAG TPA: hypothetical protein VFA47_02850, partial [Candidatus Manganitrophaceae bacterium]|nr:hypothetical protein [Candidatus Manganitrophaceae bacterium]